MRPIPGAVAGLLAALALSTSALAHSVTASVIEIIHPAIPAPAVTASGAPLVPAIRATALPETLFEAITMP